MYEKENTGYPAGTVAEVMQAGYVIHDRLAAPGHGGGLKRWWRARRDAAGNRPGRHHGLKLSPNDP